MPTDETAAREEIALELHHDVCTYCRDDVHVYYQDCGTIHTIRTALTAAEAAGYQRGRADALKEAEEAMGFYVASFPLTGRTAMEDTLLRRAINMRDKFAALAAAGQTGDGSDGKSE